MKERSPFSDEESISIRVDESEGESALGSEEVMVSDEDDSRRSQISEFSDGEEYCPWVESNKE